MKKLLGITLGIMTALGGFVDLGQIVFTTQAGALFGYKLMWAIALGTAAIIVYMEMCGRIAVVAKEPVFAVVRDRLGRRLGLGVLIASNLLNLITCAAELGGIAIVLRLLTGWPERLLLVIAALAIGAAVFVLQFQWIERIFGDRKSTRLNSSHMSISYAVFCLKKKNIFNCIIVIDVCNSKSGSSGLITEQAEEGPHHQTNEGAIALISPEINNTENASDQSYKL